MDEIVLITGALSDPLAVKMAKLFVAAGVETIGIDDTAAKAPPEEISEAIVLTNKIGDPDIAVRLAGLNKGRISAVIHCQNTKQESLAPNEAAADYQRQLQFLKFCRDFGVKQLVVCHDAGLLYGRPEGVPIRETDRESPASLAAVNQLAIETYLPLLNIPWVAARMSHLYGPGYHDGLIPSLFDIMADDENFAFGVAENSGEDFLYIDDAAAAVFAAINSPTSGIFNICSGREVFMIDLVKTLRRLGGSKSEIEFTKVGAFARQLLFSPVKAAKKLGWQSKIDFRQGVENTVEWLKEASS